MPRVNGFRDTALALAFVFCVAWFVNGPKVDAGRNQNANSSKSASPQTDTSFDQAAALAELRKSIAGKEQAPAETVFKNIQLFKGMPAGRVLRIMELGYSRSLGVTCTHCHIPGAWEKDDKPTKQVARDMAAMVNAINSQHLKQIKNLKSDTPTVNC